MTLVYKEQIILDWNEMVTKEPIIIQESIVSISLSSVEKLIASGGHGAEAQIDYDEAPYYIIQKQIQNRVIQSNQNYFKKMIMKKKPESKGRKVKMLINWDHLILKKIILFQSSIVAISLSSDGRLIAYCGIDGVTNIFDINRGGNSCYFPARGCYSNFHNDVKVISIKFSPDNLLLVSTHSDEYLRLWNVTKNIFIKETYIKSLDANYVDFSPDGNSIILATLYNTICIWNYKDNEKPCQLYRKPFFFSTIDYSPNLNLFAFAGLIRNVIFLRTHTMRCLKQFIIQKAETKNSLKYSSTGQMLAIVNYEKGVKLFSKSGKLLHQLKRNQHDSGIIHKLVFSPNGIFLACASQKSILLWNITTRTLQSLRTHSSQITSIQISCDSRYIVSGSIDGELRIQSIISYSKSAK